MQPQIVGLGDDRPVLTEPVRPRLVDGADRAIYLETGLDPVLAMVHMPSPIRSGATGVILSPPFGWDAECTHRARRVWAVALAKAGHPAVRIDHPGTGDSAGSPYDPDRLAAWTAALAATACWLRDELGCVRVVGLGLGFGGMMAWLAAAEGAPIDDLVLWAVPTSGRRLLHEIRATSLLSIDPRIEPGYEPGSPDAASVLTGEDLLDEAGQITTGATSRTLSQLDLTKCELADPTRRRVLLFKRSGAAADKRLHDYLEASGAQVTVENGDSYGAMMQYVQLAEIPRAAIARSISWLSDSEASRERPRGATATGSRPPVRATEAIELTHDGVTIRETTLTIKLESGMLRGILTEPVSVAAADVGAVFFSGGSDRRIGPNRMWVDASRRWAARGVPAVRIDPYAIGDSDGDEDCYAELRSYYDPGHVKSTIALLDNLQTHGLPGRFVLVGFCSGAYRSFHVAMTDRRVAGVFAINLPFFFWSSWLIRVRHSWVADREPRPSDSLIKTATLRVLQSGLRVVQSARLVVLRLRHRSPDKIDLALEHLRDQGTELLLLFKTNSKEYNDLLANGHMDRLREMPNVQVKRIPGSDRRFRPLPLQRYVNDTLDDALSRVLQRDGAAIAAGLDGAASLRTQRRRWRRGR